VARLELSGKDGDELMEKLVDKGVIEREFHMIKRLISRAQNFESDDLMNGSDDGF